MSWDVAQAIKDVDQELDRLLPGEDTFPQEIHRAARYSVFAGGKRLRPLLTLATSEIFGVTRDHALPAACALELVHTYSLIHDDLPALDDDDYRRGRLSSHKMFGEALAILAGDSLLTLAFETLAAEVSAHFSSATVVRLVEVLAKSAGMSGMIGGQVVDMLSEGKQVNAATLDYIHRHKTGALFTCCIRSGAIMGGASLEEMRRLTVFAQNMGLAFQIVDDILDITGDETALGKKTGADQNKQKATYPALYGLKAAEEKAQSLLVDAEADMKYFGESAQHLLFLAKKLVNREK